MLEDNAQSTTTKKRSMVDLRFGMLLWGVWSIEEKRKTKRLDLDITRAAPPLYSTAKKGHWPQATLYNTMN
jgi:hypothetical protein